MPKINRIRIANMQYDKKVIKDLFLNCYGGENVLLNLANGGGKSVLVQLLQQPLLPESKMHNRDISSYLSPEQASYILIEWKLDNTSNNYLLTGIAMNKQYSSEDMNKTKYFTFLHEYQSSNEFDIKNIPFIQKEENNIIYKSFDAAQQLIKNKQGSTKMRVYGRNEQVKYREDLTEYGIFTNEWKILAKMNENEGGVDELFKDCKTSDNLVNKWILKTISDSNEQEGKELREMFASLMEEIIEKEKNIQEKDLLEKFKEKVIEYKEQLQQLVEEIAKEQELETGIKNIYCYLQNLSEENQQKMENIMQEMAKNDEELKQIDYEQLSEEFYHKQSDLEAIQEQKQEKLLEQETEEKLYKQARLAYRIQKVSYLIQQEKEILAKIDALQLAIENTEKETNTDNKIIQLEYNLKEKYEQMIKQLIKELEKIKVENENRKQCQKEATLQREKLQKQTQDLSIQVGRLIGNIDNFEKSEKQLWEELQIFIHRNLLQELDEKEIQTIKKEFETNIIMSQERLQQLNKHDEQATMQIQQIEENQEKANQQIQLLTEELTQKRMAYNQYQMLEDQVRGILEFHRIKTVNIFAKQDLVNILQEKQLENKRKIEEIINQIDKNKQYILDLEQGSIHTSHEISRVLENANIDYITGEEYLKKQTEESYRKQLLEKNPLLPYSYIVSTNDLEKIKILDIKEESSKLSPIITYDRISDELSIEDNLVQIENTYFLSLYDQDCFSISTQEYKEKLEMQLEEVKNRKEVLENELKVIEEHRRIVDSFQFQEQDRRQMEQEIMNVERKIQSNREEIEKGKENKFKQEQEKQRIQIETQEKRNILHQKEEEQRKFIGYLNENTNYVNYLNQKEKQEKQIVENQQKIDQINFQLKEWEDQMQNDRINKSNKTQQLELIEKKKVKIPNREKQEILDCSLEELEANYEQLTKKYEQNKQQLLGQIADNQDRIKDIEKQKKDYEDILQEEYAFTIYSEEMEELAKEKMEKKKEEYEQITEQCRNIEKRFFMIEAQFQNVLTNLKNIEKPKPLPAYQIKGNYEKRKKQIAQKKQEEKQELENYERENKKIQDKLNHIARSVEVNNLEENQKIMNIEIEEIDIKEVISQYNLSKQKNKKTKDIVFQKQVELISKFQDKHKIISAFLNNVSMQSTEIEFQEFYYIYERMEDCLKKLMDYIEIIKQSLQNIEQDKKNILLHATKQAIMLYQEMKKISDSSKMRIGEKYIQILKIEIPQELKEHVEKRMEEYIDFCIQTLREECKQYEDKRKLIETKVNTMLSDRQLLNLALDMDVIKVKLYKFDIENNNSGLRQWEDVMVGNSGGQRFIACFALICSLIEYTRKKELEEKGEEERLESSKVFILDNPFGKTSSKHLLEPMIEISKKFHIQMICLSDLSQSSITDKFTLIYQLALRSTKYSNKIYLTIDDKRSNGEFQIDSALEEAYFRNQIEQISFLSQ